ncbi:MAG: ATP-binding protein [Bacteroidota bacterium]
MDSTLKSLLEQGKNQTQDFTISLDNFVEIAQILSSFANSDGGSLFVGLKSNGKITGINPEEEKQKLHEICTDFCKPALKFETRVWQEGFRLLLEVKIAPDSNRNITAKDENGNWKIFIRSKEFTLQANKILGKIWNLEKKESQKLSQLQDKEQTFLNLFTKDIKTTLSQLYDKSSLEKSEVDDLLSQMVFSKFVEMEMTDKGTFYCLI